METLVLFLAQMMMVFLLGIQSLNVQGRHYLLAQVTSSLLGVSGFHITSIIANAKGATLDSPLYWAYVLAGPIGISLSIFLHPYLKDVFTKIEKKKNEPLQQYHP